MVFLSGPVLNLCRHEGAFSSPYSAFLLVTDTFATLVDLE